MGAGLEGECLHGAGEFGAGTFLFGYGAETAGDGGARTHRVGEFVGIVLQIEELFASSVGEEDVFPVAASHHDFEERGSRLAVIAEEVLAGLGGAVNDSEGVKALPELGLASGFGGDAEEVGEGSELLAALAGREFRGPGDQEGDAAGNVEERLFLPGAVVAQMVAVIGEEADDGVFGVATLFDGVEDAADAVIDIGDGSVVAGADDTGVPIVDVVGPEV